VVTRVFASQEVRAVTDQKGNRLMSFKDLQEEQ
jgi:hypothetical protein